MINDGTEAVSIHPVILTKDEEDEVMSLAAVGMMPGEIAMAMKWPTDKRAAFCFLARVPDSQIALLIAAGRTDGRATPQKELHSAAAAGNVDAILALQKVQARNRFDQLLNHMDEDEFTD